jgi:hypothetical protein
MLLGFGLLGGAGLLDTAAERLRGRLKSYLAVVTQRRCTGRGPAGAGSEELVRARRGHPLVQAVMTLAAWPYHSVTTVCVLNAVRPERSLGSSF